VHAFSRTRALPQLRTSDKRIFLETRATLYRLAKVQPPPTLEIRQAVENLARFLDSLSVVSRRESLRLHDRAQLARAGVTWKPRSSTWERRRSRAASWGTR